MFIYLCAFSCSSLVVSCRAVTSLAFRADGFSLVSGSEDGQIRVWDTRTRDIVRLFPHGKGNDLPDNIFINI